MNSFEEAKIKQSRFGEVCTGLYNLIFLVKEFFVNINNVGRQQ